jgi:hypothetical protein
MRRIVLCAFALAACGGPPDINGMYQTIELSRSANDCTGASAELVEEPPPYFRIVEQTLLVNFRTVELCDTSSPASCRAGGGFLTEETDDGYDGWLSVTSGDESNCTLGYLYYDASLDGDELTFESMIFGDSGPIAPCSTDEAERRGRDMGCMGYEVLIGMRID